MGLVWLYLILFVAIAVGVHPGGDKPYEGPAPVRRLYPLLNIS
jgi:hypothetical protein